MVLFSGHPKLGSLSWEPPEERSSVLALVRRQDEHIRGRGLKREEEKRNFLSR